MVGHEASKPLLQSLEELANFALVPEFINTPAKISQQVGFVYASQSGIVLFFYQFLS